MTGLQTLPSYTPGSANWQEQRRTALGGSEIAAVLGLSPFESAFALWHRKAGLATPTEDKPEMEWGRRLESAICRKWLDTHAADAGHPAGYWESADQGHTWLRDGWKIASPDHMVQRYDLEQFDAHERGIVEVKHPLYDDGWGPSGSDQVPVYYLCQARWYMHVLDLQVCHFAVLIGGCDYREYTVSQDDADVQLMVDAGRRFLDSLATGVRPPIDGSDATYQVVRALHPEIDPDHIEIDLTMARDLVDADRIAKEAAEHRQQMVSEVLDAMGRAKHADVDGERIAYRTARTKADGTPGTPYLQLDRKAVGHLATNRHIERTAS